MMSLLKKEVSLNSLHRATSYVVYEELFSMCFSTTKRNLHPYGSHRTRRYYLYAARSWFDTPRGAADRPQRCRYDEIVHIHNAAAE